MSTFKPCPVCKKPVSGEYQPFCSKRCSDIDLGRWFGGSYAIPTSERPEENDNKEENDED